MTLRIGACLSLTGRYARFGRQAALGLEAWRSCDGAARLRIDDDRSDPRALVAGLRELAARCDLILGPYSTGLVRAAGRAAAEAGGLLWNHGGAGDDVQAAFPGHLVSVLTPAGRYAEPFVRRLPADAAGAPLVVVHGRGSFGRRVADGTERLARELGIPIARLGPDERLAARPMPAGWCLLTAGAFEEDIRTIEEARRLDAPPTLVCAVAAGVHDFGRAIAGAAGVYGIAQWFPGVAGTAAVGPSEAAFGAAHARLAAGPPDYPAVQAAAAAALATHCARLAGTTEARALWSAAAALDTVTLFGDFRIDPVTGAQTRHRTVLVRWIGRRLRRIR